ncbi:MAG: ankyrin repeat domain-containing protein [Vicinamibacterales bacterium]
MLRRHLHPLISAALLSVATTAAAAPAATLLEAVRAGDAQSVRTLLRQKADVNRPAADGTTPLHAAVERDDETMVELLIKSGADVKAINRYGVPPIAVAAVNGHAGIMARLLDAGADPNVGLSPDETPIMTAARTGKVDAIKTLLAHGAKVNDRDTRGQTPLMWAAARNNTEAVRLLLEGGADLTLRTNNKPTGRSAQMTVFLSPQPTGFTALLFAVRAGSLESVKTLLDAGAEVNDALSDGESALVVAAANAHWEVANLLLDRGADPNHAGAGWNALHQTVHSRRPNLGYTPGPVPTGSLDSIEVVKKLLAKGIDVNARMTKNGMKDGQRNRVNRLGATAFFLAAKTTDLEAIKVLLAAGADPTIPAYDGTTPLMVAAGLGMWYVGEDGGSLPGQEDEATEVVKLIVEQGADVNAVNKMGETPLHGAAFRGVNAIAEFLVEKGAKLDAKDMRGWTPLFVANGLSHGDVFKQQPQTAELLTKLMKDRGLSTEGQVSNGTECLDCIQTHPDQAKAAIERDVRMEAEFAEERRRAGKTPQD